MFRFLCLTVALSAVLVSAAAPARAQDVMTKESVASLKASFVADLDTLHQKFLGLAQAFPQDKYTWRPMDGVRSVSEVLMLAAMEGYSFIPMGFGAKAAGEIVDSGADRLHGLRGWPPKQIALPLETGTHDPQIAAQKGEAFLAQS